MSRGFVKEEDQEEIPIVPPRADLPNGVPNFVTQAGMDQLLAERQTLLNEREKPEGVTESDKRIAVNFTNAKLQLLNNRISAAQIVNTDDQPRDEVRFGAYVTLKITASNTIQTFQIVGVDEATISRGKISFISPLAKVLLNKKAGEKVVLKRGREDIVFQILDISYR
jgi:transcription elongation factor GreB